MSRRRDLDEHNARVSQFERDGNVAGLIQELGSTAQGRSKYSIPRADAALALGRMRATEATPHLVKLIHDPEMMVRMCVFEALGVMQAKDASDAMIDGLKDPHRVPRQAAAEALGRVGAVEAIPKLREVLDTDPDGDTRLHAIESLLILGASDVRDRVPEVLRSVGWRVRSTPRWKRLKEAAQTGEPLTPWFNSSE